MRKLTTCEREIILLLMKRGPLGRHELAGYTGRRAKLAGLSLREMRLEKLVETHDKCEGVCGRPVWRYVATEFGTASLECTKPKPKALVPRAKRVRKSSALPRPCVPDLPDQPELPQFRRAEGFGSGIGKVASVFELAAVL